MKRKHSNRVRRGQLALLRRLIEGPALFLAEAGAESIDHSQHQAWLDEITKNVNRRLGNR